MVNIDMTAGIGPPPLDTQLLLAIQWKGNLYIDKVLPFGLCSAPLLFAAEWIICQKGVQHIWHYLAGEPYSTQYTSSMASVL